MQSWDADCVWLRACALSSDTWFSGALGSDGSLATEALLTAFSWLSHPAGRDDSPSPGAGGERYVACSQMSVAVTPWEGSWARETGLFVLWPLVAVGFASCPTVGKLWS